MICWVNGPFGVGKTSVAAELGRLLLNVRTVDPERLGRGLQRTVGRSQRGDFQHQRLWRRGTVLLVRWAARADATVVVPLSVLRPDYLDELLDGVRASGHQVHHVMLDASQEVLRDRIADDDPHPEVTRWRSDHVEVFYDVRAELAERGATVDTVNQSPEQVARTVAAVLSLAPERSS